MTTHTLTFKLMEKVGFTIGPKDSAGNPAQLDSPAVVESLNPAVVSAGEEVFVPYLYARAVGSATVMVRATSNGVDVTEQIDVTIQPAQAVTLGLTFQAPQPK